MKTFSQEHQVIEALRREGGYATFRRLNEVMDFSTWKSKTPEASVRRIVQESKQIFKIQPGLWALEECRDKVLRIFELKSGDKKSEEFFTHGYYQGLLVEIGKFKQQKTYVPPQDKHRLFLGKHLCDICDMTRLPDFTNNKMKQRATSVDVIWFNEREMPSNFYEVEHTTDIKNSLSKFYELQDFHAGFFIVADARRKHEFEDKLSVSMFAPIEKRVRFLEYDKVVKAYEGLEKVSKSMWQF